MKKGFFGVLVVFLLFFLSAVSFGISDSDLSNDFSEDKLVRIFDFDNDGRYELLGFSEKQSLDYYDITDTIFFRKGSSLGNNLERCSLSYQDFDLDGDIDVFYSCFDDLNIYSSLESKILSYTGSGFEDLGVTFDYDILNLNSKSYGDTLFFDFDGDGYSEILSCFLTKNGEITLFKSNSGDLFNGSGVGSGIFLNDFILTEDITNCHLSQLDFDGDNDLDVLAYTYDANTFTLYNNTGGHFTKLVDDSFFNKSFFSNTKIKTLKTIDENQDGFSDLYYVIDTGELFDNKRNIEFGYFENTPSTSLRNSIEPPTLTFNYHLNNPSDINFSWMNYSGDENYFDFTLIGDAFSYNLNIVNTNYVYGDLFENSNDYNYIFGNLLHRNSINLSLNNQIYNFSAKSITASGRKSDSSDVYFYKTNYYYTDSHPIVEGKSFSYEICDGLDNDGINGIDNDFDLILPNGSIVSIIFPIPNDNFIPSFTRSFGDYSIDFNCSKRALIYPQSGLKQEILDISTIDVKSVLDGSMSDAFSGDNVSIPTSSDDNDLNSVSSSSGGEHSVEPTRRDDGLDESIVSSEIPATVLIHSLDDHIFESKKTTDKILKSLTKERLRHNTRMQYVSGQTKIYETIKNLDLYTVKDIILVVTIPKVIVDDVSNIVKVSDFSVIEPDTIISFELGSLDSYSEKTIQYIFDGEISELDLNSISYEILYNSENLTIKEQEIDFQIKKVKQVLDVNSTALVKDNITILTLEINVDELASLENVSIYQEIPKCLLEEINDQVADSELNFEIIESDPLIVWHFDKLINSQKIELAIGALADENCTNLVKTVSLAKQIIVNDSEINFLNVFLAALLVPFFAIILILFGEFSRHNTHDDKLIDALIKKVKHYYANGLNKKDIIIKLKKHGFDAQQIKSALSLNAKSKLHFLHQRWNVGVHEIVLLFLVFLNILDFVELLPGDVDYFKKIISWIILGYLLYRSSISSILIGRTIVKVDILLIISFFLLTFKNLVGFAKVAIWEAQLVQDLYAFIWKYNNVFETYAFVIGLLGIIFITLYLSKQVARRPSLVGSFVKKQNFIKNLFVIYSSLLVFFIAVFNLMFEWLAIAVDAFVVVLTIGAIIYIIFKHSKKLNINVVLEEVSEDSEKIYEKVISLFHYKKFLPLAFSGMLILYVLTEIANFIVPYITGIHDIIYFGNFDIRHLPLFNIKDFFNVEGSLFASQSAGLPVVLQILLGLIYILNVLAIVYLLFLPARIWYNNFKQKHKPISETVSFIFKPKELGLFFTSIVIFFSKPVFELVPLRSYDIIALEKTLVGVDILTKAIDLFKLSEVLLVAVLGGVVITLLAYKFNRATSDVVLISSGGFFTYYVYLFFVTQKDYYVELVNSLFKFNLFEYIYTNIFILVLVIFLLLTFFTILFISKFRDRLYGICFLLFSILNMVVVFHLINLELLNSSWKTWLSPFIGIHMILFAMFSFIFVYGLGFITMVYLYVPVPFKQFISKFLFTHQNIHHIGHKDTYLLHHTAAVKYVRDSIKSGHELFVVVKHLEVNGWNIDDIEDIVHDSIDDEKLWVGFDHLKHQHHNKHIVEPLHQYIKSEYYGSKIHIADIIKEISSLKLTLDDVIYALKKTAPDSHRKAKIVHEEIAEILDKHFKALDKVIVEAEKNGADLSHLHAAFKFVKTTAGSKLVELIASAIFHKQETLSELMDDLKNFKFSEDDIRVALINIKPQNALDEEIIRYL